APARSQLYTLSLHDALPILIARRPDQAIELGTVEVAFADAHGAHAFALVVRGRRPEIAGAARCAIAVLDVLAFHPPLAGHELSRDRKSTRLNSSHVKISYAV